MDVLIFTACAALRIPMTLIANCPATDSTFAYQVLTDDGQPAEPKSAESSDCLFHSHSTHQAVPTRALDSWQTSSLSIGSPTMGLGLLTGTLSLLLACLGVRLRR